MSERVSVELGNRCLDLYVQVGLDAVELARVLAKHRGQAVCGVRQGRPFHLARGVCRQVLPGRPELVQQIVEAAPVGLVEDGLDAVEGFLADRGIAHLRGLIDHLELDKAVVEPLDGRDLHTGLRRVAGDLAGALRSENGPLPDVAGRRGVGDVRARHLHGDLAGEKGVLCRIQDLVDAGHGFTLSPNRSGRSGRRCSTPPNPCTSNRCR